VISTTLFLERAAVAVLAVGVIYTLARLVAAGRPRAVVAAGAVAVVAAGLVGVVSAPSASAFTRVPPVPVGTHPLPPPGAITSPTRPHIVPSAPRTTRAGIHDPRTAVAR
jgi:hypothetical protein